eukprot:gene17150-biopygen17262
MTAHAAGEEQRCRGSCMESV